MTSTAIPAEPFTWSALLPNLLFSVPNVDGVSIGEGASGISFTGDGASDTGLGAKAGAGLRTSQALEPAQAMKIFR